MSRLSEVAGLFLKLGFTAFGGPAAHMGIMQIAMISLFLLLRHKINSTWLIAAGAIAGFLFSFIR
jgi:chromate transport protein ChrA